MVGEAMSGSLESSPLHPAHPISPRTSKAYASQMTIPGDETSHLYTIFMLGTDPNDSFLLHRGIVSDADQAAWLVV